MLIILVSSDDQLRGLSRRCRVFPLRLFPRDSLLDDVDRLGGRNDCGSSDAAAAAAAAVP